jgi:hypothetical protein
MLGEMNDVNNSNLTTIKVHTWKCYYRAGVLCKVSGEGSVVNNYRKYRKYKYKITRNMNNNNTETDHEVGT